MLIKAGVLQYDDSQIEDVAVNDQGRWKGLLPSIGLRSA